MSENQVTVIASVRAQPQRAEMLHDRLLDLLRESSVAEPGLLWWSLARSDGETEDLVVVEHFLDKASYDHHEERPEVLDAAKGMREDFLDLKIRVFTGALTSEDVRSPQD